MYIYKTVFQDREEFTDEEYEKLKEREVLFETDYGTTEILKSTVDALYRSDNKEELKLLTDRLGTDVMEAFKEDKLDFVLIV